MKTIQHQKGQALILIVAAMIALFAITALAIDGGNGFSDKRHAQSAADTAALAAALAKAHGQDWSSAAFYRAANNGYTNDGVHSTVLVRNPPNANDCDPSDAPSSYVGNHEYIEVIIYSTIDTLFAPVIGIDHIESCVEAIARAKPETPGEIAMGNALVSLNLTDCKSFIVTGNSFTTVTGSGVFVNSNCSTGAFQAFDQSGNQSGISAAEGICVVGGATYVAGNVVPPPTVHCGTQIPYPPPYIWPNITCASAGTRSSGVLTPGTVPATWIDKNVTLQSGVYCVEGDIKITGPVTGVGVLLVLQEGNNSNDIGLHINGAEEINLSAMTTGPYAGLLVYAPPGTPGNMEVILNGGATSQFTGTILTPSADIQVNGGGSSYGYHSQFIGWTVETAGGAGLTIHYEDDDNYDIGYPPELEISR